MRLEQKSDRINSDRLFGLDQLGSTRIEQKNRNKIKVGSDQLGSTKKII